MPFKVGAANLPKHVKDSPEDEQKAWVNAFNSKWEEERGKGTSPELAEERAFAYANGVLKKIQGREGPPESEEAKKVPVTKGMANAAKDVKVVCGKCGLKIPKYTGRYPTNCPKCDTPLKMKESMRVEGLMDLLLEEANQRDLTGEQRVRVDAIIGESESPGEEEIEGLVDEIREARLVQTRGGVGYPKESFAYVPDAEKPSTWKLLIKDERGKWSMANLAAACAALGKGYRGKKVEIPQGDREKVKAKIRAGYTALGKKEEDMPKVIRESSARAMVWEYSGVEVDESTKDMLTKGLLPIRIIQPGWNDDKSRFYTEEAMGEIAEKFRGLKMYVNHQTRTEKRERPEGDVWEWVANVESTRVAESGAVVGIARINDPRFKEKLQGLEEAGQLADLGVSIRAVGRGVRGKVEGISTHLIEGIVKPRSCDFVTEPGAGGRVGLMESRGGADGTEDRYDVDLIDVDELRSQRPDLVESIEESVRKGVREELRAKMEIEEKVAQLEKEKKDLEEANQKLTQEKEAEEAAKRKIEVQGKIKELIEAAKELPEASRKRLLEDFAEAESDEGVARAIEREKKYLADLVESGDVKDLGAQDTGGAPKVPLEESVKELETEFARMGMNADTAKAAASI